MIFEKFLVEIISPDRSIIKTETNEVVIPSYEGEMGILKDHIPLITFLRPGLIKISGEKDIKYFVEEGVVEFSDNNLLILTSTAKDLKEMDNDLINNIISNEEKNLNSDQSSDKKKYLISYKINTLKEINQ